MRRVARLSAFFAASMVATVAAYAQDFDTQYQTAEWPVRKDIATFMQSPDCKAFTDYTFDKWVRERQSETIQTDAVIVLKGGEIQYEKYFDVDAKKMFSIADRPSLADMPHILWSASKSVTATIVARAIEKGDLKLDSKLAAYYQRGQNFSAQDKALYDQVNVQHLLEMSSGFKWNESYESDPKDSSVTKLLYTEGSTDSLSFALNQPMIAEGPGKIWNYSSGNSTILFGILRSIYGVQGSKGYHDAPWTLLFDPLGMKNAFFEVDAAGHFVGSSYVHLRPRDMAKLGQLYLNDGKWNGQQLLPASLPSAGGKSWTQFTGEVAEPYAANAGGIKDPTGEGVYGLTWWLNKKVQVPNSKTVNAKPYPCLPEDFYGAFGHYGQYIFIVPSLDLVVIRTATDRNPHMFDVDAWMASAMQCLGMRKQISNDAVCKNK